MFANYLKIAWRNMRKHKLFSFINIFGLALSLSVCMMVLAHIKEELSYDKFHPHAGRTYRVLSHIVETKNNKAYRLASTPLPLKNEMAQHKDVVQDAVQIYPALRQKAVYENKELHINGAFTDPSFFNVFGFRLAAGNEKTALEQANGIVLNSETAAKFFCKNNPVGKVLQFEDGSVYQVTGVLEPPVGKSHLAFDAYASAATIPQLEKTNRLPQRQTSWNTMNESYTYVLVRNNVSSKILDQALRQTAAKPELKSADGRIDFVSQPLSGITPGSDSIYNEIGRGTVWAKLLTVIGVGFVILAAACFNYTNLTIARALTRAKEVGIRKAAGANRYQIFTQYIIEAVLIALLALVFAMLGLVQFKPDAQFSIYLLLSAVLFTIFTGAVAGALPAWILSSFKPVNVLKNNATQKLFGNLSLQKGLMVFQFSLSLFIIIFLATYYRQFSFLQTVNAGFYAKNIITIPYTQKNNVFLNAVAGVSGVERIARTSETFGMRGSGSVAVSLQKPVGGQGIRSDYYFTDAAIVPVHQLTLVAGSNFPEEDEFVREKFILINEKAAETFGYKNTASAVGKTVWLNDSTQVEIKGVLKNFYDKGAARYVMPLLLRNQKDAFNYVNIQVRAGGQQGVVKRIGSVWNGLYPHTPFEYEWLDKKIAQREDQRDAYATMGFLAFITVSIAALGLLGLVIYTVETRQKEISIRKVIGASVPQLIALLSKSFLKLLLIAGLIAMPVGYIASFIFLQNFANRVPLGPGTLLLCFSALLSIGLITIFSNTYKAASANPAKNLHAE